MIYTLPDMKEVDRVGQTVRAMYVYVCMCVCVCVCVCAYVCVCVAQSH